MSATDELRKLLDERGVEHYDTERMTEWHDARGLKWNYFSNGVNTDLTLETPWEGCTPEQAIAATLGNGTCEWQGSVGQGWCQGAYDATIDEYDGFFTTWHHLGCGHGVLMVDDEMPNFCPLCGREVIA